MNLSVEIQRFKRLASFNYRLIFTTLVACLFIYIIHDYGLGVSSDSTVYFEIAGNLSNLQGFVNNQGRFISHWPPLYTVVIALISVLFDLDIHSAAGILNTTLIFFYILIFNEILHLIKVSLLNSILLSFILSASVASTVFLWAWSEPLFITLLVGSYWVFMKWKENKNRSYLVLFSISSGLLFLTRYAAIGFIFGFVLHLLFFVNQTRKNRYLNTVFYLIGLLFVVCPWFIYNYFNGPQGVAPREFVVHIISAEKLAQLGVTFKSWIVPGWRSAVILLFAMTFQFAIYFRSCKGSKKMSGYLLPGTLFLSYTLFLFLSISFFDYHTPLDNRILSPTFFLLVIIFSQTMIDTNHLTGIYRKLFYLPAVVLLFCVFYSAQYLWNSHFQNGSGYTGTTWSNSETLDYAKQLDDKIIYTNANDILRFHTNLSSDYVRLIPSEIDAKNNRVNNNLENQLMKIRSCIIDNSCEVIYFESVTWRWYLIGENSLKQMLQPAEIVNFSDGLVIR